MNISFVDEYAESEKNLFYEEILRYRKEKVAFASKNAVNSYMEIPDALKQAYEKAKNNKETFSDIHEYDVEQNVGPKVERETTVLPNGPYFVDMVNFRWA